VTGVEVEPGVRLAVHAAGPQPPAVVLVHGLASTARLWAPVAAALAAEDVGTVAVDLRGHGDSDLPDHGFDTPTAADDLARVVRGLATGPVVLAGQSWGGNVVLRLAAHHPDLVAGLALVDGGWIRLAGRYDDWVSARAALTPPPIDGLPLSALRAAMAPTFADFPAGALDAALSVVRVLPDGTVRRRLPVPRHLQILESLWAEDPREHYPRVVAPTLLMPAADTSGEVVGVVGQEVADGVAGLSTARLRSYPGAHHDLHLQRPLEVAADLRSLL